MMMTATRARMNSIGEKATVRRGEGNGGVGRFITVVLVSMAEERWEGILIV